MYAVAVVGSGASGLMSSITAARVGKSVLLLEKMPSVGLKLKASGGGKCNLTNTLKTDEFIDSFGKGAKFMRDALKLFDSDDLLNFFKEIGLKTHAPDGFRVFPQSHNSKSVLDAFNAEMKSASVDIKCNHSVKSISKLENFFTLETDAVNFRAKNVIIATGGMGYKTLGTDGDGYKFAKSFGHNITPLYPAMLPLHVEQDWVKNCIADTIAKVTLKIDMPKMKSSQKRGDLIFTKNGIRGPVVLDFATEVTPLLDKYAKVPILVNFTKGMNEEEIREFLKTQNQKNPQHNIVELLTELIPKSISKELCKLVGIDRYNRYVKIDGRKRDELIKLLAWTPLTVTGHGGFEKAMVTKGGVRLKEIDPKTMQSKIVKGLYFCGEVVDLDGACGGYNLQWAFSSGFLAGCLKD